jgi:hypothetical protein
MTPMRTLRRSLLLASCLTAAIAPVTLLAIEADQSSAELQSLVAETRELLPIAQGQVRDLRYAMARAEQTTGDTSRMFSGSYEYRELKRTASRLTEIGNSVYTVASRCGDDGKKVGNDFKSSVRRLNTHVNRVASSSSATLARMATEDLEGDLQEIAGKLQTVAGVSGCSSKADQDADEEAASQTQ